MDIFYVRLATGVAIPLLGILDDATVFHVVARVDDKSSLGVWRLFQNMWLIWAGAPMKVALDEDPSFCADFSDNLDALDVEFDYV